MKPQHQINELFIKNWLKLELLDMLARMETLELYQCLKMTSLNLINVQ